MVIWEGSSLINGDEIFVVATLHSKNRKTGNIVQTWILVQDTDPVNALKTGDDVSICGNCLLRGKLGKERPCYVNVGQAPLAIWNKWLRGGYPYGFPDVTGKMVRLGAYGDPAAVPIRVWHQLLRGSSGHLGYTHQWRKCDKAYQKLCMASCETELDAYVAHVHGWRTFRVKLPDQPIRANEIQCPASEEMGHRLTCEKCGACDGGNNKRRSIVINGHGGAGVLPVINRILKYQGE